MDKNLKKDIGVKKSHILFLCLVMIVVYSIISYLSHDQKKLDSNSVANLKTTGKLNIKVHKIDKGFESYNKLHDKRIELNIKPTKLKPANNIVSKIEIPKFKSSKFKLSKTNSNKIKLTQIKPAQINSDHFKSERIDTAVIAADSKLSDVGQKDFASFSPYKILKEDKEQKGRNKFTNNLNSLIYWVDGSKLKVLSILSINEKKHKIAVITVPLFGQFLYQDRVMTIGDFYKTYGRIKLTETLEKLLEVKLDNYVLVQQTTLEKVSSLIGPVKSNGESLYITKAFEETLAGVRKDDQDIVRALGEKLVSRSMWYRIPQLVWIFSREVETDFDGGQLWDIYKAVKGMEVGKLNKKPILGIDYQMKGKEYRVLQGRIYKNIIYDLTR